MEKTAECNFGVFNCETNKIIKFEISDIEPTIEDVDEFVDMFEQQIQVQTGNFVSVIDGTKGKWISSSVRIHMGKRVKELESKYAHQHLKTFIVVPNAIVKMMLKGVNIVSKPTIEQVVCSTISDAEYAAMNEVANW